MALPRALIAALAGAAALAAAPAAGAHVQVLPARAAPTDAVEFTVLVPNERDRSTTRVELKVPDGAIPFAFEDVPGWRRSTTTKSDGALDTVRWSGELPPGEYIRFTFLAGTPDEPGPLEWKALQTYDDGRVVRWIGPSDSDEPAAVTVIDAAAPRANAGGESAGAGGDEPAPADPGTAAAAAPAAPAAAASDGTDALVIVAIALGALGTVLGAAGLLRRR